jgi:hypothetical protein
MIWTSIQMESNRRGAMAIEKRHVNPIGRSKEDGETLMACQILRPDNLVNLHVQDSLYAVF